MFPNESSNSAFKSCDGTPAEGRPCQCPGRSCPCSGCSSNGGCRCGCSCCQRKEPAK